MNQQCYNGGTCQTLRGSDSCSCAVGYLGRQCEYSGKIYKQKEIVFKGFCCWCQETILISFNFEVTSRIENSC